MLRHNWAGETSAGDAGSSRKKLHVCTFVNDRDQYQGMLDSMRAAGFDDAHCRFTAFENISSNSHDPFKVIPETIARGPEPYVMFLHQDVLTDRGPKFDDLMTALKHLNDFDPAWAVAGTGGVDRWNNLILCLDDPTGSYKAPDLPKHVTSLDEHLLIFRRSHPVKLSHDLSGFHFYGTDACLHAHRAGYTAYVINFHVTHLSCGNAKSQAFLNGREAFAAAWRKRLLVGLIYTTCTEVRISRIPLIERLLSRDKIAWCFRKLRAPVVSVPTF